ncbi:MAG: hypothetical protein ACK4UO_06110 [Pseudolabrys sp.]
MTPAAKPDPVLAAVLAAFPGAEVTDVRVQPADSADDGGKAAGGYSLAALAKVARDEAVRILETQQALVIVCARTTRHAGELERSRQFEALARLAERCAGDGVIMAQLRKTAGAAKAGAA